jgi:hypothetical protein
MLQELVDLVPEIAFFSVGKGLNFIHLFIFLKLLFIYSHKGLNFRLTILFNIFRSII